MEGLNKLKGSRKAYRSHLTHIYGKLDKLDLTQPPNEDTIITVTSYIKQMQRKAESIQQLDTQIQSMMEDPTAVEDDVSDSLETQDLLIEKITRLKRYLEKNSSATHAPASPVSVTHETAPQPVSSRLPKLDLPNFLEIRLVGRLFGILFKRPFIPTPSSQELRNLTTYDLC